MRESKCNTLIEKYPHLYKDPNPEALGGRYYMQIGGFETSEGWYDLLDKLSAKISKYLEKNPVEGFHVHQVKSKFGGLCYYTSHYDDNIRKFIKEAEHEANITCEFCGTQEDVKRCGRSWIINSCILCEKKREEERKQRWANNKTKTINN